MKRNTQVHKKLVSHKRSRVVLSEVEANVAFFIVISDNKKYCTAESISVGITEGDNFLSSCL